MTRSPSLSIAKSASPDHSDSGRPERDYTFTVTNTGNVTLTGVGVTDVPTAPAGVRHRDVPEPDEPGRHLLGRDDDAGAGPDRRPSRGTYTVTQADIDHGSIVDHATTQGTTPSGGTASDTSNTVTVERDAVALASLSPSRRARRR